MCSASINWDAISAIGALAQAVLTAAAVVWAGKLADGSADKREKAALKRTTDALHGLITAAADMGDYFQLELRQREPRRMVDDAYAVPEYPPYAELLATLNAVAVQELPSFDLALPLLNTKRHFTDLEAAYISEAKAIDRPGAVRAGGDSLSEQVDAMREAETYFAHVAETLLKGETLDPARRRGYWAHGRPDFVRE